MLFKMFKGVYQNDKEIYNVFQEKIFVIDRIYNSVLNEFFASPEYNRCNVYLSNLNEKVNFDFNIDK